MNTSEARTERWQSDTSHLENPQTDTKVFVKARKQSWITLGEKILYSIVGAGLILMSYYFITYSSATDSINREIQSIESQIQQKQIENESLSYEVRELSRPERIKQIAEKHGLEIQNTKVKRAHAFNDKSR